jgi:hypothetical protein
MAEVWGLYLTGNIFFGLAWFLLAVWISRAAPDSSLEKALVVSGKALLFTLLIVNMLLDIAIFTRNIPPKTEGYIVGDGLCDYTREPAALGLFEVVRGEIYMDGQQQFFIGFEVRAVSDLRNDKLVTEYAARLKWLAILDKERMSNGWLIKTLILVASTTLLIIAAIINGVFGRRRGFVNRG